MADDILRKDIESLLDSWYNAGAPQRSEDLQARHRPGEKVKPAEHDAQLSTNLAHIKTIGDIILPASQWSHSLQQLETNGTLY
jgi:hypothetical protein